MKDTVVILAGVQGEVHLRVTAEAAGKIVNSPGEVQLSFKRSNLSVFLSSVRSIDVMLNEKEIAQGICPGVISELSIIVENDTFAGGDVVLKCETRASQNCGERVRRAG